MRRHIVHQLQPPAHVVAAQFETRRDRDVFRVQIVVPL